MIQMIHKASGKIRDIKPDHVEAKLARGWEHYTKAGPAPKPNKKQVIVNEPVNVKIKHDELMLESEQVEPTEE